MQWLVELVWRPTASKMSACAQCHRAPLPPLPKCATPCTCAAGDIPWGHRSSLQTSDPRETHTHSAGRSPPWDPRVAPRAGAWRPFGAAHSSPALLCVAEPGLSAQPRQPVLPGQLPPPLPPRRATRWLTEASAWPHGLASLRSNVTTMPPCGSPADPATGAGGAGCC